MSEDEFRIDATGGPEAPRTWTRSTYSVAKFIADSVVARLGYTRAEVRNTFGGTISDVIYTATPEKSWEHPES